MRRQQFTRASQNSSNKTGNMPHRNKTMVAHHLIPSIVHVSLRRNITCRWRKGKS